MVLGYECRQCGGMGEYRGSTCTRCGGRGYEPSGDNQQMGNRTEHPSAEGRNAKDQNGNAIALEANSDVMRPSPVAC